MKARVKATNKIVDIFEQTLLSTFGSNDVRLDEVEFLEGDTNFTHDYWTRLEHQYAGMAMQGILMQAFGYICKLHNWATRKMMESLMKED